MATSLKNIGYVLIVFSIVLIIFLIFIKADNDKNQNFSARSLAKKTLI